MKQLSMIGVPMDLGQMRRGVDMGPSAIRYAGVLERLEEIGYEVEDLGDLPIEKNSRLLQKQQPDHHHYQAVKQVNEKLAHQVSSIFQNKRFPLVLGGDHSIAIGTIAGAASHFQRLGVIWLDAHGDVNTKETSPSGNIHGMPLAISLGYGDQGLTSIYGTSAKVRPEDVVLIATRELDPGEKMFLKKHRIKVFTMHEIDLLGMPEVMKQTVDYLKHCDGVHLSFDLDSLDPDEAPGVGTPVNGGLTYRESLIAVELLHRENIITSAEFVEVNPILDERNKTAEKTVELISSLLGEKLL